MPLGILFWVIAVVAIVFGVWGPRDPRVAPYAWWPTFILCLILGWQVFGPVIRH